MDSAQVQSWMDSMAPLVTSYAVKIIGVFLLLFVARLVAGWCRKLTTRALTKANFDPTLTKFCSSLAYTAVMIFSILAALGVFGVETTSFAAVIAAAGLAVGLAFQGTLSNFSAGVMLLVFRPFGVGQFVNAGGTAGTVEQIGLFTTTFDTPDNRRIIVPNSAIVSGTIENVSFHETRRVDVAVGTDYSASVDQTRDALMRAAKSLDTVLEDPAPAVVLGGLGDSAVDWAVRVWVKSGDYWPTKDALTRAVKMELDKEGIGIPFPQMDVHLDQVGPQA